MRSLLLTLLALAFAACSDSPTEPRPSAQPDIWWWNLTEEIDPYDNSPYVALHQRSWYEENDWGENPNLVLRCRRGELAAYIDWETFVDIEPHAVAFRVGDGDPTVSTWSVSTDYEATFHAEPFSLIRLLNLVEEDTQVFAETTPYGAGPLTAIFEPGGLPDAHLDKLASACPGYSW